MNTLNEKAYAKLNISLDVGEMRPDGYHEMCMVMQSVYFCDDVALRLRSGGGIGVSVNLHYLPRDERNIAYKAARLFFEHIGEENPGLEITINKRIPVCAGLGGGSSDGAAVLRGLNRLTGSGLSNAELEALGERLGSDVPFCISGGTVLATGRGEKLLPIEPFPDCVIVICKPRFSVSTPQLFASLDRLHAKYHPDTPGLLDAIVSGNLKGAAQRMFNVFEDALPSGRDQVTKIKSILIENGAFGAAMTGTGSAVFGVFEDEGQANQAALQLGKSYREVFITAPRGRLEPDDD